MHATSTTPDLRLGTLLSQTRRRTRLRAHVAEVIDAEWAARSGSAPGEDLRAQLAWTAETYGADVGLVVYLDHAIRAARSGGVHALRVRFRGGQPGSAFQLAESLLLASPLGASCGVMRTVTRGLALVERGPPGERFASAVGGQAVWALAERIWMEAGEDLGRVQQAAEEVILDHQEGFDEGRPWYVKQGRLPVFAVPEGLSPAAARAAWVDAAVPAAVQLADLFWLVDAVDQDEDCSWCNELNDAGEQAARRFVRDCEVCDGFGRMPTRMERVLEAMSDRWELLMLGRVTVPELAREALCEHRGAPRLLVRDVVAAWHGREEGRESGAAPEGCGPCASCRGGYTPCPSCNPDGRYPEWYPEAQLERELERTFGEDLLAQWPEALDAALAALQADTRSLRRSR